MCLLTMIHIVLTTSVRHPLNKKRSGRNDRMEHFGPQRDLSTRFPPLHQTVRINPMPEMYDVIAQQLDRLRFAGMDKILLVNPLDTT
jgi:hypothetical protein